MDEKGCTPEEVEQFVNSNVVEVGTTLKFDVFTSDTHTDPIKGKFKSFNINDERPGIKVTGRGFYDADRIVSGSLKVIK